MFETWERTLAPFETSIAECRRTFADVASRYSEPGRHYHTLDHIGAVLATVRSISEAMAERPALSFAVFLHDAVYDTHASDNEERSAAFARDILQTLSVPEPIVEETARLILLTKTHQTELTDIDGMVLLDADLAILGAEPPLYDRYAVLIRREYAWVPEEDYRVGRLRVLESILQRSRIYVTDWLFIRSERQARENLRRECDSLHDRTR